MMKKKTLATLLTLTMLATAAVPVFAADKTSDTGNAELTYTVESTFTMIIPANTTLTDGIGSGTVSASDVVIPSNKLLNIKVKSTNYNSTDKFRLKDNNSDNYIKYTIKNGETAIDNEATVLSVAADTAVTPVTLNFALVDLAQKVAGTYTDTLTFTATVE